MRWLFPVLVAALSGMVVLLSGALLMTTADPRISLSESRISLAYSCGYRAGQVSITSRLPALFTNPADKEKATGLCVEMAKMAIKNGFSGAAEALPK